MDHWMPMLLKPVKIAKNLSKFCQIWLRHMTLQLMNKQAALRKEKRSPLHQNVNSEIMCTFCIICLLLDSRLKFLYTKLVKFPSFLNFKSNLDI